MSFYMQKNGHVNLADMLINTNKIINGMYAEYAKSELVAGERSHAFYMNNANTLGYIRLPIAQAFVDDKAQINFMSYISSEATADMDFLDDDDVYIRCATLAVLDKNIPNNDILLFTVDLNNPVKLVKGVYLVIHTSMRLGDA